MKMLLIDAGNSRIKWVLVDGEQWLHQGALDNASAGTLSAVFSRLPVPDKIFASNVSGMLMADQIRAACSAWPCSIMFITAQAEQCGVRNTYEQPGQLGSDRWASLIAAWRYEHTSCLVINCGTATTVDSLSAEGEFLGGLILPGIEMMRKTLAANLIQLSDNPGSWREFPRTTADAILTGAIRATTGAIRISYETLVARSPARCLLSGGAADYVQPYLGLPLVRADNLVLRGLQIIGQVTEE